MVVTVVVHIFVRPKMGEESRARMNVDWRNTVRGLQGLL